MAAAVAAARRAVLPPTSANAELESAALWAPNALNADVPNTARPNVLPSSTSDPMSSADAALASAAGDVEDDAFGVVELLDHSDAVEV